MYETTKVFTWNLQLNLLLTGWHLVDWLVHVLWKQRNCTWKTKNLPSPINIISDARSVSVKVCLWVWRCVCECEGVSVSVKVCPWVWRCVCECEGVSVSVKVCPWVWRCVRECEGVSVSVKGLSWGEKDCFCLSMTTTTTTIMIIGEWVKRARHYQEWHNWKLGYLFVYVCVDVHML